MNSYFLALTLLFSFSISFASGERAMLFDALYSESRELSYGSQPGTYTVAPLALKPSLSVETYHSLVFLMGSFGEMPRQGTKVRLKSFPFNGDGVSDLADYQYFSGYRWFWLESEGMILTPIQGGYYDLSSVTLPTNVSVTYADHVVNMKWTLPSAEGYGVKIVYSNRFDSELDIVGSSQGKQVYSGFGTEASFVHQATPGESLAIAFFGMKEINNVSLDSGSGVQSFRNDSGSFEVIGGVFGGFADKSRVLVRINVPRLDTVSTSDVKIIPQNAPPIVDSSITGCESTTTANLPSYCYLPWPNTKDNLIFKGFNISDGTSRFTVMQRQTGVSGSDEEVDASRITEWHDDWFRVTLPNTLLDVREPCREYEFYLEDKNNPGMVSNSMRVRIINANYFHASRCSL
jgi:hypothetical protein